MTVERARACWTKLGENELQRGDEVIEIGMTGGRDRMGSRGSRGLGCCRAEHGSGNASSSTDSGLEVDLLMLV